MWEMAAKCHSDRDSICERESRTVVSKTDKLSEEITYKKTTYNELEKLIVERSS